MKTEEQKEANKKARQEAKALAKEQKIIENEKNQLPVDSIVITIEWKKSRMWGHNPHCETAVTFKDSRAGEYHSGFLRKDGYTSSGCGYDKESTVIADVFNDFLKYKLWNKTISECERKDYDWKEKNGAPYGISAGKYKSNKCGEAEIEYRSFSGGIGTSCYYAISEFIGGKFEKIASGSTFDVYVYKDGKK